ncbi:Ribonuclease H-like superfamily protein [Rhynchospora pubera]|uniref:Ribonuclease H-like superfamily protein n=1 Tax=Rhynchospora pubera TaxID=906938 RepID=A0AAV8D516_9POAL|nr:Ribonuclease H-like superfamily protein [Rhynchospora pubera]
MSVFKIPCSILQAIDKLRRDFLWYGVQSEQKKLRTVPWDLVCRPKHCGGLGVIDLKTFNLALLSKWLWKWITPNDSLWKMQLNALYHQHPAICPNNTVNHNSLLAASFIFQTGLTFAVGNGQSILLWHHNWGYGILRFNLQELYSFTLHNQLTLSTFANNIINPLNLFNHLLPSSTNALSQLRSLIIIINNLRHSDQNFLSTTPDKPIWKLPGASGTFSTNSTYHFIKLNPLHSSSLSKIWSFKMPPRFQIFIWRMLQNKIATLDNLQRRGWSLPNRCVLCYCNSESTTHLFSHCRFYLQLRSLVQEDPVLGPHTANSLFPEKPMALVQAGAALSKATDIWAAAFFVMCTNVL